MVDENITREDARRRLLVISASSGPAVLSRETVTEVLCTDFLLSAGISTAGSTLIEGIMTTSKKTLRDKVCTITTVAAVAAVLRAKVRPGIALQIAAGRAVVVGLVPPGLGIRDSLITVVSSRSTSCKGKKSNNSLHFKENKKKSKKERRKSEKKRKK